MAFLYMLTLLTLGANPECMVRAVQTIHETMEQLPPAGSEELTNLGRDMRDQIQDRGYSLLNLEGYFTEEFGQALRETLPQGVWMKKGGGYEGEEGAYHFGIARKPFTEFEDQIVRDLGWWFKDLHHAAFDGWVKQMFSPYQTDLRTSKHGLGDPTAGSEDWHIDGARAVSSLSFLGIGTKGLALAPPGTRRDQVTDIIHEILPLHTPFETPRGHALTFFGQEEKPNLIHKVTEGAYEKDRVHGIFRY